jgi:hypothetical protein
MNYQEALKKLNKLLGISHSFNSYKVNGTDQEIVVDGDLRVGENVYTVSENGQIPAPDMEVELDDSTQIIIKDGKVQEISYDMEKQEKFVEAMLKDGTVVESATFDVGEEVFVVGEDGTKSLAPDGEHELALKDSEGREVVIRIITKDGKIVERMNVEEANPEVPTQEEMGDLSIMDPALDEDFKKVMMEKMDLLMELIERVSEGYEDMKSKVEKFSKEPAGTPISQPKNISKEMLESKFEAFEKIRAIRNKK